jgi:hypothetical protein
MQSPLVSSGCKWFVIRLSFVGLSILPSGLQCVERTRPLSLSLQGLVGRRWTDSAE